MTVVLVRHSVSAVDPSTSAHAWGLTSEGHERAAALEPAAGWERAADVVARFALVDGAAICSGGRAICAVVAHHTGCDGFALWRTLSMPHIISLNRDDQGRWVASPR